MSLSVANIGLIMSNYIYSKVPFNISYAIYCFVLGIVAYGLIWYLKNEANKKIYQERKNFTPPDSVNES
jgi:cbb3-type cytochrome oxidase subunit 3